jgi:hypothetical protein
MTHFPPIDALPDYLPAGKLAGLSIDELSYQWEQFCAAHGWDAEGSPEHRLTFVYGKYHGVSENQTIWLKAFIAQWDAEADVEENPEPELWIVAGRDGENSTDLYQSHSQAEVVRWAKAYVMAGNWGGWKRIEVLSTHVNGIIEAFEAPDDDEAPEVDGDDNAVDDVIPPYQATKDNERRCENAYLALGRYTDFEQETADNVADLLTDLRHFCHREGIDFGAMNTHAAGNFWSESRKIDLNDHPIFAAKVA